MTNQTVSGNPGSVGMNTMLNQLLNAGQLLFDRRVPLTLKLLLPVAALVYLSLIHISEPTRPY